MITDGPKILKTLTYNQPNERYQGIIGVVADTFTNNSNFGREMFKTGDIQNETFQAAADRHDQTENEKKSSV